MKKIRLIIAATALLGLLASCEKDFTVETGTTPVEFVYSSIDTTLNNSYIYIPVKATENVNVSSLAKFEYMGGTLVNKADNSQADLVDGSDIIFTSKEIYVGAYDEDTDSTLGYSSNNIEARVPNYLNYQSITFKLQLTGEYLGQVTEMTYTATAPTELDMTGTWSIGNTEFQISEDANGNFIVVDAFFGDSWTATRAGNTLTFNSTSGSTFNMGDPYGDVTATFCAYHEQDGTMYLWPDEVCVWDFADNTVTVTNGVFIGFESPADGGWYSWSDSTIDPGTVGSKS